MESVDRLVALLGAKGFGKSWHLVEDSIQFRSEYGGYTIAHSPTARLPERLGTVDARITWHDSIRSLEGGRGISRNPDRLHVVVGGDPEPVIEYARNLATAIRRRAVERAGYIWNPKRPIPQDPNDASKKISAPPVYIGIDEGTALRQLPKGSDELREWQVFLTGLRHEHIALTWAIQSPSARNWILLEQASEVRAFRYQHEWGLNAVRARAPHLFSADELEAIATLPKYQKRTYVFNR